jgi:hypothetical protein
MSGNTSRWSCGLALGILWTCGLGCSSDSGGGSGGRISRPGVSPSSALPGATGAAASSGASSGSGFGNPNLSAPQGVAGTGTGTGANGAGTCATALVNVSRSMPTVVFVIDGSGSMCATFGNSTRWKALRTALLDPMKGLIYRLQNAVSFGATLYDGTIDLGLALGGDVSNDPACALTYATMKDTGDCPQLIDVMPPQLNNAAAIDMKVPMTELGGSTPTDKAMSHVMDALIAAKPQPGGPDKNVMVSPTYVILATDGAPNDICVGGMGGDGSAQQMGVLTAVDRGVAAGITTWAISLAGTDKTLQARVEEIAKHGDPKNAMAHAFSPMNPDELITTLATLLGGAVGCNVALQGKVKVGSECMGTVDLNGSNPACCQQDASGWTCQSQGGAKMPVMAPNGWHLVDDHTIELVGDTCTNFLLTSSAMLFAKFPCSVFTPS